MMNRRRIYVIGLTALLLGVVTVTSSVWLMSSFSHGEPDFDQGCYCHNGGIAVFVNGTGDGEGGVYFSGPFEAGTTFHLLLSTNDANAVGVVPGLQLWESNQTNNAKFTFSPTQVTDNSAQDVNKAAGNITALYKVTIPISTASGFYILTPYAQGQLLQQVEIKVGASSTTSTTSTSTTSTSTTSTSTTSTSTTSSSTTSTSTTSTSTTSTSTTSTAASVKFTSPSSGAAFIGPQSYTISGTVSPTPLLPDAVFIVWSSRVPRRRLIPRPSR